jgi:hypothetical protein
MIQPFPIGQNCSKLIRLGVHLVAQMRHLAELSQIYKTKPSYNEFKPLPLIEVSTIAAKSFAMTH